MRNPNHEMRSMVQHGCIICGSNDNQETVEHIIPRSLGNLHYILPKGVVCKRCNNRFAHVENRVLSSPEFVEERRRLRRLRNDLQEATSELEPRDVQVFVGKMVFEGLYQSRRSTWRELPDVLRQMLDGQGAQVHVSDIPPITANDFKPVPKLIDRWRLRNNQLELSYLLNGRGELIGRFVFGKIALTVRLV